MLFPTGKDDITKWTAKLTEILFRIIHLTEVCEDEEPNRLQFVRKM